ncbi:hypothetical protein K5Y32_07995 [Pantoea sp. DY-15]|uniref:hypothetical protein n=1 Tax=unclassified Pantoea TaxID=2630326 RepID=UPI001C960FD1|nr:MULTISPECIES: hypothetical protein [unclassified Pantoea]MBY4836697.1 hypothetical protein [Pantoea sp. DY-5]MBY4887876.1 hypothetical protein [Pantoea sp. DY-15]
MKNSNDKQLCDIAIGDAVMELFNQDAPVSRTTLLAQLEKMIHAGVTAEEVRIARLALSVVKSSIDNAEQSEKNVMSFRAKNVAADDSTQH